MDVMYPQCVGLDVHQQTVVACARRVTSITHDVRTFGTRTAELLALSDWLAVYGCAHVAMEATGVYWKPVWHVLEGAPDAPPLAAIPTAVPTTIEPTWATGF